MIPHILIPMAGRGHRFQAAGYDKPKPLIDVDGQPMIHRVLTNLMVEGQPTPDITFICLQEHVNALDYYLGSDSQATLMTLAGVTEGAACTVLAAQRHIDPDTPLLIANCDQWLDWSAAHFYDYARRTQADGMIPTFKAHGPKWSYVTTETDGEVTGVAEKVPISDRATCGVYYFRKAQFCFDAIGEMIRKNIRTNGEFYLAPAYNELLLANRRIYEYPVPKMWGLGTPEDLQHTVEMGVFAQ